MTTPVLTSPVAAPVQAIIQSPVSEASSTAPAGMTWGDGTSVKSGDGTNTKWGSQ